MAVKIIRTKTQLLMLFVIALLSKFHAVKSHRLLECKLIPRWLLYSKCQSCAKHDISTYKSKTFRYALYLSHVLIFMIIAMDVGQSKHMSNERCALTKEP